MKIRELEIYGLRNFPPEGRRISFVDPYSDRPRQLTVLVGSNGSGKTSVLDAITTLVARLGMEPGVGDRLRQARSHFSGIIAMELGKKLRGVKDLTEVSLGRQTEDVEPFQFQYVGNLRFAATKELPEAWREHVKKMLNGRLQLKGGAIYLQCNRGFPGPSAVEVAEPEDERRFAAIVGRPAKETSPLTQFWVWQNYLDLEAQAEGRPNLTPFIDVIEDLLGQGQRVRIKRGRVTIERPHLGDSIEPHELPSGELQILTLFGELLRYLRPGAIVLIDELEISLHPALQRAALHKLRALARKHDLQLILTTHSMEIVSAVAPEEVVLLDDILMQEGITPGAKAG